jgi:CubicO group peptidase (beta-lactamase class C family)
MKKKIFYTFLIVILIAVIGLGKYLVDRAEIFTGFAAKDVASCMFVAGRSQQSIEAVDINFFPVNLTKLSVDTVAKMVTGSFFGFGKQTAVYRQGIGCALVADGDFEQVRAMRSVLPVYPAYPETVYWPTGDKMRAEKPEHLNLEKLNKAMAEALKEGNTRAIVVAYDTLFMAEMYAEGFDENTPLLGWSMTKSVTNALVGILVKDGKLDIDAPAPVDAWKNDERKNITLRTLLHMTSGLEWEENYGDISDATVMLYRKGDISGYAMSKPAAFPPDSVWYYSSGTTNIISRIIRNTINNDVIYWGFPRDVLFNRIGMRTAVMETDAAGTFVGSSYCFASGRDWARFGLLYLFDGVWNGDTILPPGWVDFTREEAPHSGGKYGAQFWLNKSGHEIPDAPDDVFFADGYHGQRVYIIPSKRLVIVRLGESKKGEFDYNKFVTSVLDAFE